MRQAPETFSQVFPSGVCATFNSYIGGIDKLNHCPKQISRRVSVTPRFCFSAFFNVLLSCILYPDRNVVADETVQEEGGEADVTEEMAEREPGTAREVKTGP